MKLTEVKSSNVKAIGYDESTKDLYVEYNAGTYVYENVPAVVYEGLVSADSKGQFMNKNVKGFFSYHKA